VAAPPDYAELNELLDELVGRAASILGDDFVGAYLTGSFALGGADDHSDCDFMVVTARRPTPFQEEALRELHAEIPTRPGYWAINLEGSYAPVGDLATLDTLGEEWLEIDRGWREMEWSAHCNTEDVRWTLHNRGLVLAGPEPKEFVAPVPASALRQRTRELIATFLPDLFAWTNFDIAWTQRYAVETICRLLYTLDTSETTFKRAALEWGLENLDAGWRHLIRQVLDDRAIGWDPDDPPRPGSVDATLAFIDYAQELAWRSSS
jgi:predicted nucleotidyltransferase